jgi:chromosome segregation ATPase
VCGYQRLHGSVMGTVDLYDYGLRRPVSIGPTVAKSSIFYGTITMITVRRDGFQAALIDIQNQRNTLYENTQVLQQQNASYLATINQKGTSKQQRARLQQLIKTNEYQIKVNTKTITRMDMDIANRQQQIERLNSLLQTIEQNKKNAAMSRMRYLVGMTIPNTRDAIRSNTNGLIPEYVSNDNRIYLSLQ